MSFVQMLPTILIVIAIMIFIKAKIVRIICTLILIALGLSVLSYVGLLPNNFNIVELFKEWFGIGKIEGVFTGGI